MQKIIPLLALLIGAAHASGPAGEKARCLDLGRRHYDLGKYADAAERFKKCVELDENDADVRISYAGSLLRAGKLPAARREFETSLDTLPEFSPLRAYCHSRIGDIAVTLFQADAAIKHYSQAAKLDPRDANAFAGLGKAYELKKDWKNAASSYRAALLLDPANVFARQGLQEAEVFVMTAQDILAELKERGAVPKDQTELTGENRALFNRLRAAEKMNAIDYLKKLNRVIPPEYVVERKSKDGYYRLLLTLRGYEAYRRHVAKDALQYFEKQGLKIKEVFLLRDMLGKPIFEASGMLTESGMETYFNALIGVKKYLLPDEPVPASVLAAVPEEERAAAPLKDDGFMEIAEPEYLWLAKVTQCSEETFKRDLDMRFLTISNNRRLYFIDATGQRKDKAMLFIYINSYRNGNTDTPTAANTGFFGLGAGKGKKPCTPDGRLWH